MVNVTEAMQMTDSAREDLYGLLLTCCSLMWQSSNRRVLNFAVHPGSGHTSVHTRKWSFMCALRL